MPEGQAKPCDSCKWVDVLRASLKQQVKSCCICLKTGQATGSHQLSGTEFKINLPTTGIISILFSTQESSGPSPPSPLFFYLANIFFCLSLRIPHETVIFIMLQYLSSGKSLLALPRTRVCFSASVCSLAMCVSYPVNDTLTSVTAMLRADATKANYFSMYCNHAQTLKYEVTSSNVEELGTRLRHAPCF